LGDLPRDPRDFLPLKDLVFRILVALAEGEQHGWSLVQSLDEPSGRTRRLEALVERSRAGRLLRGRR
jgi:hypothetical protein